VLNVHKIDLGTAPKIMLCTWEKKVQTWVRSMMDLLVPCSPATSHKLTVSARNSVVRAFAS